MRWVIGDIHGMLIPLEALLREVWQHDADAKFFFTGDYVNRGPDSREAIDLLLSLPDASFARGNHDDIFDLVLNQKSLASGTDPVPAFAWFLAHGLDKTLLSYAVDPDQIENVAHRPSMERIQDLV